MLLLIIVVIVCCIGELTIFISKYNIGQKRERDTLKSLYKLMERRVLSNTLKNNITAEQAARLEYNSAFLRIEFLDTKPWLAYIFSLDDVITVGRSKDNMICIRDDRVSRIHYKITNINGVLYLQDLGTVNGSIIKRGLFGKKYITSQQFAVLEDKDVIVVGSYRMKIEIFFGYEAAI